MSKKEQKADVLRRKEKRKDDRVTLRFSEELRATLEQRALDEQCTLSALITRAVVKYLDFKMPRDDEKK